MSRVTINVENHIAHVKLNRPDKMNALDQDMLLAIIDAADQVSKDSSVRCVVLSGEGRCFCAGIDVSMFTMDGNTTGTGDTLEERTHGVANLYQKVAWAWREAPIPVIAAAHGIVYGGGLQIFLGADIKYIAPDTKLSVMEMKWGLIPDMAGTQLMRHNVRDDIIRELTYTHRVFSGEEAVAYGFATHTSANPLEDAMQLAQVIASKSPSAIVKAKKVLNQAPYLSAEEGLMMESVEQEQIIKKKNQLEAIMSSMQKVPGNYEDYRD